MEEHKKITSLELTMEELSVLVDSIGRSSPTSKENEVIQFKLYHKLLFKLNEFK